MKIIYICIFFLFSFSGEVNANESEMDAVAKSHSSKKINTIPYKQEKEISEKSGPILTVLFVFVVAAAIFVYFFKKKLSITNSIQSGNIKIIETKRLNTRLTVFHIEVKNKEIIIVQSGDNIKTLDIHDLPVRSTES